jgi:DNA (cytosine-5)-methyltransferase 1
MKYLSLCSGIEAATVAWHPLGWEAVAYSEIERFPSEVLAHHYPSTPNLGDMTKFKEWNFESDVDLLVGGTPCQSFSVAGLRKGLDDPRGNLMLTYLAIADKYRPRWLVWENVPGVLSSNGGKDFGVFLGALGELGYGFAYRVLDAQYFGVAQRRRRVFVVGYLGDWRAAAAVLFERHSLQGHPAPSREKREDPAKCLTRGANQRYDFETEDLIPAYGIPGNWIGRKPENGGNATEPMHDVAPCLTKADQHGVAQPIAYAFDSLASNSMKSSNPISGCNEVDVSKALDTSRGLDPSCNQGGIGVAQPICLMDQGGSVMNIEHDMTGTLRRETHGHEPIVMQAVAVGTDLYNGNITGDVAATMGTPGSSINASGPTVMQAMAVRRLTPVECERLQGFGDNYTDIKSKDKPTPDGPRYKALGNSMAVPVMAWIGQRIEQVEAICKQNK